MADPRRVRVVGDLFHGRVPAGAVYVGRAAPGLKASPYANPHSVGGTGCRRCPGRVHDLNEASWLYGLHLDHNPDLIQQARAELAGRDLACWCAVPAPGGTDLCHGAILLTRMRTPEVTR